MSVFSEAETGILVTTWALIDKDRQRHGLNFFQHMFTEHPEIQTQFFFMMSMGDADKLAKHGVRVIDDVATMVSLVEKKADEKLVEKIRSITKNHTKRGVDVPNYKILTESLLEYLIIAMGANLNQDGKKVWQKLLNTLVIVAEQELERKDRQ